MSDPIPTLEELITRMERLELDESEKEEVKQSWGINRKMAIGYVTAKEEAAAERAQKEAAMAREAAERAQKEEERKQKEAAMAGQAELVKGTFIPDNVLVAADAAVMTKEAVEKLVLNNKFLILQSALNEMKNKCKNEKKEKNKSLTAEEYFRVQDKGAATMSAVVVEYLNYKPEADLNTTDSENMVIPMTATLITNTMRICAEACRIPVNVTRNQERSSALGTTPNKSNTVTTALRTGRVDLTITHSDTRNLVFFGEEKRGGVSLEEAKKQIRDENRILMTVANYGTATCLPVYCASGSIVEFYLYSLKDNKPFLEPLWEKMDVTNPTDRILLLVRVIAIFRFIRGLIKHHLPTEFVHEKEKNVYFEKDHVLKKVPCQDMPIGANDLYQELESSPDAPLTLVRGTIIENENEFCQIKLTPVGYRRPPQTRKELHTAITCVLGALKWLHDHGWVHRDCRWANLLRLINAPWWMLIDYEFSAKMEDNTTSAKWPDKLCKDFQAPPSADGKWGIKQDLWQVVFLLVKTNVDDVLSKNGSKCGPVDAWMDKMEKLFNSGKDVTTLKLWKEDV